ncbi:hypothetical protein FNS94_08165 [Salmonella enterica]|nr:hypothetical protein [Salmonella enterica]
MIQKKTIKIINVSPVSLVSPEKIDKRYKKLKKGDFVFLISSGDELILTTADRKALFSGWRFCGG